MNDWGRLDVMSLDQLGAVAAQLGYRLYETRLLNADPDEGCWGHVLVGDDGITIQADLGAWIASAEEQTRVRGIANALGNLMDFCGGPGDHYEGRVSFDDPCPWDVKEAATDAD